MYTYKYPRPALTADCLVVGIGNDGGRVVLLVKRGHEPYEGCWALPGGFMEMEETLEACAQRELAEETGLTVAGHWVELGSFSRVDRDPRGRTVTVVFGTKVPIAPVKGADDAAEAAWFSIDNLPPLAFDHQEILQVALPRLDSRYSK